MNKRGNPNGLKEYNNAVKEQTEQAVLSAIETVRKSGKKFTLQAVCEEAGVSRTYFTKHPELMAVIKKYRDPSINQKRTKDSKDVIIETQKATIARQNKIIKAYEVNENYKEKYEKLLEKCDSLEAQIKDLLEQKIDLNF